MGFPPGTAWLRRQLAGVPRRRASSTLVAGAGMGGLVAAARLRELGRPAVLRERGDRVGGSMLLSSGVVWRHRELEEFRRECPDGDAELQRLLVERLDDALRWLESLGAPVVERGTGNPLTTGVRFDPRGLAHALARAAPPAELGARVTVLPEDEEVVLATGGFGAALARACRLPLRASPWSTGDGLRLARRRGAAVRGRRSEFYGRALPAPPARVGPADFVPAAQLYGRHAHVADDAGRPVLSREPTWSETELVQAIAALPGGQAWYVVDARALEQRVRDRPVAEMVAHAERLGGEVRRSPTLRGLGLGALASSKLVQPPFAAVRVVAAVTHTLSGLAVDRGARVLRPDGSPLPGLYAAGVDAGGIASGGYASGLATGLVLGLAAAETLAGLS